MKKLIKRVRALSDTNDDDYTVNGVVYWDDQQLQDTLDSNVSFLVDVPLTWMPQTIGGGTVTYLVAQAQYRDFEEAASGTARWIVRDSTGASVGTANYTPDYRAGRLTFSSDQGGTAYYLTAFTYDVYLAAADVWEQRLANFHDWYDFRADNQTFTRSQAFNHAKEMASRFRAKAGDNIVANSGNDVRTAEWFRIDVTI